MEPKVPYEEFGLLHENAEEFGLSLDPAPALRRVETVLDDGRRISAIRSRMASTLA